MLNVDFNGNVSDDSARTIFERHDADGNDALDMTEFTEFLKSMFQALQPHHTAALRHRALSPTDLAQATAGQAFAIADLDHDGRLSFDEFKQWLQSGQSRFGPSGEVAEWRREVALRADAEADAAAEEADAAAPNDDYVCSSSSTSKPS